MKKTILTITVAVLCAELSVGGLPVIDYSNLIQNTTTALKQVAAYTQQVQQYQIQILQYKNQLLNTLGIGPALQVWQSAQQTMGSVMGVANMFQNGGNLQNTLSQFQNVNYWLQAPPSSYQFQTGGSVAQKSANDALWNGIQAQQQQITADAQALDRLQAGATTTQGQNQALQMANQLAALEQKQLLQIRQLLLQEQQSLVARNSTTANDDAMRQAATQQMYSTQIAPQPHTGYAP